MQLLGRFVAQSQPGKELPIPSRKGQALIAVGASVFIALGSAAIIFLASVSAQAKSLRNLDWLQPENLQKAVYLNIDGERLELEQDIEKILSYYKRKAPDYFLLPNRTQPEEEPQCAKDLKNNIYQLLASIIDNKTDPILSDVSGFNTKVLILLSDILRNSFRNSDIYRLVCILYYSIVGVEDREYHAKEDHTPYYRGNSLSSTIVLQQRLSHAQGATS